MAHIARIMLFACVLFVAACIERSNPFDPINGGTQAAADIRKQDFPALAALIDAGSAFTAFLKDAADRFGLDSAANAETVRANAGVRAADALVRTGNAEVETYNQVQANADSLRFMARYGSLDTLAPYVLHADFGKNRSALQDRVRAVSRHIDSVNGSRFPLVIYSRAFIDSAMRPLARDSLAFSSIQVRADSANAAVRDSNVAVHVYNDARAVDNRHVAVYNETIDFRKRTRNLNVIVRSDSLQSSTFLAKAGDSLFLGPGTFNVDLRFTNSGTPDSPIVVRGYPGRATIIRPLIAGGSKNAMIISKDRNYIRFESLVFRGGVEGSVKLEGNATKISFRNCLFDSSQGPGLEAYDSDLEMKDCEVRANGGPGVRVGGGVAQGNGQSFINVLFARNGGAGLEGTSQLLDLRNCTLADNGIDGIQLITPGQAVNVTNTVIAFNKRFGLNRHGTSSDQELLTVFESVLFGNGDAGGGGGNWSLEAMDAFRQEELIRINPIVDPEFIDPVSFNYNPKPGSYLDASEKRPLPVVIGYRKVAP